MFCLLTPYQNTQTRRHQLNLFTPQGFVFLDIYDIGEYNPFLLEVKQPPDPKVIPLLMHFLSSQCSCC